MHNKKNAFDLLRILLAICVIIAHSYLIAGYKSQDPLVYFSKNQTNLGLFGVMGFFTISGYLITASFERSKSIFQFISHRVLRIFPGYWFCLLFTAFVITPILFYLTQRSFNGFYLFGDDSATSYIFKNFFLRINQWSINNVLAFAYHKNAINGSLWSLYAEVQCYCFTIVAGYFGLFNKNKNLYLVFFATILVFYSINTALSKSYGPTLLILSPALSLYPSYLAGSIIYTFRNHLILDKKGTIFLILFTLALLKFGGFNLISPFLIALSLINAFQLFEFKLKYDVSYGVYIYSFPLQQVLFQIFGTNLPVSLFIIVSILISILLGLISYIFVEKPSINLGKINYLRVPIIKQPLT